MISTIVLLVLGITGWMSLRVIQILGGITTIAFCDISVVIFSRATCCNSSYNGQKCIHLLKFVKPIETRPRDYKTFFLLNTHAADHEIFSANKYENAKISRCFHIN